MFVLKRKFDDLKLEVEELKTTISMLNKFKYEVSQQVIYNGEIGVIEKREFNFYKKYGCCAKAGNVYTILFLNNTRKKVCEDKIQVKQLYEILNHQTNPENYR